ncbi:MAG TPA: LytTR family DNA-binding domain-containing protein [Bacteroidales bacterium]|nr:LytTR family DNA-binding domain-containing protein [Bacteroidales bacterium]HNS47545.1 LytTR family DNA-binding domain-containing protein [Bacteroidales bacterium]
MENIPKKITTLIVEDEPVAVELLEAMLDDAGGIEIVDRCQTIAGSLRSVLQFQPEIIFLDILLGEENGFDLINALRDYDVNPSVIFVTGHDEFVLQAIRHAAFDYLLKPVDPEELKKTLSRYRKRKVESFHRQAGNLSAWLEAARKIRFNTIGGFILVSPAEVLYCEANGNYTDIFLVDGKKHMISRNIGEIEKLLMNNPEFFRISRSIIINSKYLKEVNKKQKLCILTTDKTNYSLAISKDHIKDIEQAF